MNSDLDKRNQVHMSAPKKLNTKLRIIIKNVICGMFLIWNSKDKLWSYFLYSDSPSWLGDTVYREHWQILVANLLHMLTYACDDNDRYKTKSPRLRAAKLYIDVSGCIISWLLVIVTSNIVHVHSKYGGDLNAWYVFGIWMVFDVEHTQLQCWLIVGHILVFKC